MRLFELVLDEERGIVEFEVYATGRSKARQFLRDLRARERFPAVESPADAVRALVKRIAEGQPASRPLPRGFIEFRAHVAEPAPGAQTPGELAREALWARHRMRRRSRARGGAGAAPRDRALAHGGARAREGRRADRRAGQEPLRDLPGGAPRAGAVPARRGAGGGLRRAGGAPTPRSASRRAPTCSGRRATRRTPGPASPRRRPSARAPATENPVARALLEAVLAPVLAGLEEPAPREAEPSLLVKP